MSVDKIIERILQDAQAEANAISKSASKEKDTRLAKAAAEAEKIASDFAARAAADAATLKERRASVAQLETRKMELAAKQSMITSCFTKAAEALRALPADKYLDLLKNIVKPFIGEAGEVTLNAKDKKAFGAKLAEFLKGSKLKLSDKTADIDGGAIINMGKVSVNAGLSMLVDSIKGGLMSDIADKLFS